MFKPKTFLACLFFISSLGPSKAAPPGFSDVVIFDWFRRHFGQTVPDVSQSEDVSQPEVPPQTPSPEVSHPPKNNAQRSSPNHLAKQTQTGITAPVDKMSGKFAAPVIVDSQAATTSPKAPQSRAQAAVQPVQDRSVAVPRSKAPVIVTSAKEQPTPALLSATTPDPAVEKGAEVPHEQANTKSTGVFEPTAAAASRDNTKTNAIFPQNSDQQVAVLYVRESIKSTSDLANKIIAVDPSDATSRIKTAIEATGASDVRLSEGARMALLRMMNGEVPAAIIALETPQKAATWTDVPGFRVLRIPLAP